MSGFVLAESPREIAEPVVGKGQVSLEVGAVGLALGEAFADGVRFVEVGLGHLTLADSAGEISKPVIRSGEVALEIGAVRFGLEEKFVDGFGSLEVGQGLLALTEAAGNIAECVIETPEFTLEFRFRREVTFPCLIRERAAQGASSFSLSRHSFERVERFDSASSGMATNR